MGQTNSRWRKSPQGGSYYGRDAQISEYELFTSYAVVAELLLTHPQVESSLRALIANSKIADIRPSAATDDEELNQLIDADWERYATNPEYCDLSKKYNYYQLRAQAFYLNRAFGDSCSPILEGTVLQVTEPWRMRSPSRSEKYGTFGIDRDASGNEAIAYYLTRTPKSIYDFVKVDDVERYEARDEHGELIFLHPVEPGRPASRGISRLAPVADALGMGQDLFFAEVTRQQLASSTVFSNEISASEWEVLKQSGLLTDSVVAKLFDVDQKRFKINPASILQNLPGFKLSQVTNNINPANFEHLWKQMSNMLAVCLDIPRLAAELDPSDANYAQFRAVLIVMDERLKVLHDWWICQWDRPVWRHRIRTLVGDPTSLVGQKCREFLARKMGIDTLGSEISQEAMDALCQVRWHAPARAYTQPVHEAQGDSLKIAEGLITPSQYTMSTHAMSWTDFADKQVSDRLLMYRKVYAAQKALMLEYGATEEQADAHILKQIMALHHSEFCPLARPKSTYATLPVEVDPPKPPQAAPQQGTASTPAPAGVAA